MILKRSGIFAGVFFLLALPVIVRAQNNSQPYSIIGIGNIENSYFDRYIGMANAGLALSDNRFVNNSNTASLTKLSNHVFSFELALRSTVIAYSGGNLTTIVPNQTKPSPTFDVAFRKLSIATKVTNNWGLSLGLRPFSTSNYDYTANKLVQGSSESILVGEYHGTGGLSQVYLGNAYQVTRNTSLGINSSVLWGSLKQIETLVSPDVASGLITSTYTFMTGAYFNFSLQTRKRLNRNWMSTYGITYSPQQTLHSAYSVTVTDALLDTLKSDPTVNDRYTIPALLNAGIAFIKDNKYTFTINAQQQNWSNIRGNAFQQVGGATYKLQNSNKLSIGYQKSNRVRNYYGLEYEKSFFQAGLYGGNTYIQISGQPVTDFGATIGFGKTSKRTSLAYYFALEVGRRGSFNPVVLSENYFNVNLVLSYLDRWTKGRKYY